MEKDGYVIKSYGGAVLNENINIDMPFNIRKNTNVVGKQKIAEIINSMVKDGESLILDSSSTAVFIAKVLKEEKKNLTQYYIFTGINHPFLPIHTSRYVSQTAPAIFLPALRLLQS